MAGAIRGSPESKEFSDWVILDRPQIKKNDKADAIPCSPEPKKFPDWVLLDLSGRTHFYDDPDAAAAAVANDATAVAVDTCNNQSGYISLTLRPPWKASYLDLHWPYGIPKSLLDVPAYPRVVSSDENLLLLRVSLAKMDYWYHQAPDLFVYNAAGPSSSTPTLRRLPACTEETRGLAGRRIFLTIDSYVGILRRGGGDPDDYVVADLAVSWRPRPGEWEYDDANPPPMIAVLCAFSSRKGDWAATEMLAPQPDQGEFPTLWSCDRVIPFTGRFLCWVDYYSGIVFCDFSDEDSPALRYVPVPGNQKYPDKTLVERDIPESFRNVSVSQGTMLFVHIGNDWRDPCQTSGLTITIWNLMMMGDSCWNWEIHRMISLDDLWAGHGYKVLGLPLLQPEFPVVTKDNPDVLCCVVREDKFSGKVWMINVDMKQTSLLSCVPYIYEQIECQRGLFGYEECENYFFEQPLLPSDISRYLNKPPGN